MSTLRRTCLVALVAVAIAPAALADEMIELDKALAAVAKWTYGAEAKPLKSVASIVFAATKDPKKRDAVEQRIIRTLGAATTVDGKSFLCRQLRTIGTARSVPVLEPMLLDAKMTHMARGTLGHIEDPAAGAALHRALGKTQGMIKAGIIKTLASRRYTKALPDLVKLIASNDTAVASAAVDALGWIGGPGVAQPLVQAAQDPSPHVRRYAAVQLGRINNPTTLEGLVKLFKDPDEDVRWAAVQAVAAMQNKGSVQYLVAALDDPVPQVSNAAEAGLQKLGIAKRKLPGAD